MSRDRGDIVRVFPLFRELFETATEHREKLGRLEYREPEHARPNYNPAALPEKFQSLISDHPGNYFIIDAEDRANDYYRAGTRYRGVFLSTAKHSYDSDDMVREIDVKEYVPSEGKGNFLFFDVSDRVNEKGVSRLNQATGEEVNQPHGSRHIAYSLDTNGQKDVRDYDYNRLDEDFFEWQGAKTLVRWLRNLNIHKRTANSYNFVYKDSYLLGRDAHGQTVDRADVRIRASKERGEFTAISVEIGLGASTQGEVLYESKEDSITVIIHPPDGMRAYRHQLEILEKDPNYSFLFESPVDKSQVIELVKSRVKMLEEDWDKPGSIFASNQVAGDEPQKLIESA
jgi:hypothetical protein